MSNGPDYKVHVSGLPCLAPTISVSAVNYAHYYLIYYVTSFFKLVFLFVVMGDLLYRAESESV